VSLLLSNQFLHNHKNNQKFQRREWVNKNKLFELELVHRLCEGSWEEPEVLLYFCHFPHFSLPISAQKWLLFVVFCLHCLLHFQRVSFEFDWDIKCNESVVRNLQLMWLIFHCK
jgi:hypothetical protein